MAREVFEAVFYDTDIVKAEELTEKIDSKAVRNIGFAKSCLMFYYLECYDIEKWLQVLSYLDDCNFSLNDPFLTVTTALMWFLYYSGGDFSIIDSEKAIKHFENATKVIAWYESDNQRNDHPLYSKVEPDVWELYFVLGWYYIEKAQYHRKIDSDLKMAIINSKKGVDYWHKIPNDGAYLATVYPFAENALGWFYYLNGDVKNAEKWYYKALNSTKAYGNLWELWPNMNLWVINDRRGEIIDAKIYNKRALEISKKYNYLWGTWVNLEFLGDTVFEEGNYDEAIELYKEALDYANRLGDTVIIFSAYEYIFHFYYLRFRGIKDENFLSEAKKILGILEEMSAKNLNHSPMLNSVHFCRARILKQGNLRNKGKAIDLLEEILKSNPEWQNFHVRLDLVDSLFEDALLTGDRGTIEQIDALMKELAKIDMINNPAQVRLYIIQQITIAKYSFYIFGNIKTALDILYGAKEHLNESNMGNLLSRVENEIKLFENEVSKWDNIDLSIKDRINDSKITIYLQQAIEMADIQK